MALLGNQEKVEYYRNDSPVEGVRECSNVIVVLLVGVGLLKYCRREEERKKSRKSARHEELL